MLSNTGDNTDDTVSYTLPRNISTSPKPKGNRKAILIISLVDINRAKQNQQFTQTKDAMDSLCILTHFIFVTN